MILKSLAEAFFRSHNFQTPTLDFPNRFRNSDEIEKIEKYANNS